MDNEQIPKTQKPLSKSFMTAGPTLHYSHKNVQRCWLLAIVAFAAACFFWSKILTGSFWSFHLQALINPANWRLGSLTLSGVSIFEYPWQILVLGLIMGIMGMVPVLISQLMSFAFSLPFILAVAFLANLPGFAICLLVSCLAAASRPLRFRSRFTAIALCTAPQLFYWGYMGGTAGVEPIQLGFSFTPWVCAWLTGLAIAGFVIGIGHFTRYKPGLVWIFTSLFLLTAVIVFETTTGFAELDYQLHVAKNNPEQVTEFHDHSITEALDQTIASPAVRKYLAGFFYPTESIPLRKELKKEIQIDLNRDRWPSWFIAPEYLQYQAKKQWLFEQYDLFINRRPQSNRMPVALYYKALLSEYNPDIKMLGQKEILHFYSDHPTEGSREIWYRLYSEFSQSPESLEARWRIAKDWAGQGKFEQADKLLGQAQNMIAERVQMLEKQKSQTPSLFSLFRPTADSVMTVLKLKHLQHRLSQLRNLLSSENRTDKTRSSERLANFVMLNPYSEDFENRLNKLLTRLEKNDPLQDNILLAKTKLIADEQLRAEKLAELHIKFQDSDGGRQALLELGLLKISFWRQQSESGSEQKREYLTDARSTLQLFIKLYPNSYCADQVQKNLDDLPAID